MTGIEHFAPTFAEMLPETNLILRAANLTVHLIDSHMLITDRVSPLFSDHLKNQ